MRQVGDDFVFAVNGKGGGEEDLRRSPEPRDIRGWGIWPGARGRGKKKKEREKKGEGLRPSRIARPARQGRRRRRRGSAFFEPPIGPGGKKKRAGGEKKKGGVAI